METDFHLMHNYVQTFLKFQQHKITGKKKIKILFMPAFHDKTVQCEHDVTNKIIKHQILLLNIQLLDGTN